MRNPVIDQTVRPIFYQNVKRLCHEQNMNLGVVEEDSGLNKGRLSQRKYRILLEHAVAIARQLGVTVDYLITEHKEDKDERTDQHEDAEKL